MSTPPSMTTLDLLPAMKRALEAVGDLPPEQQQAALEAAAATARATVEMRQRLYVTGTVLANIGKR